MVFFTSNFLIRKKNINKINNKPNNIAGILLLENKVPRKHVETKINEKNVSLDFFLFKISGKAKKPKIENFRIYPPAIGSLRKTLDGKTP
tara:strand:+ start:979 stop:1248 length:270 start_codon:yes stop_codon:yes gene_type:complete